jgi:hypothetical protein
VEPRAALVSIEDQGTYMAIIDLQKDTMGHGEIVEAFVLMQEVLMRVARYSQPIREVKMVCKPP